MSGLLFYGVTLRDPIFITAISDFEKIWECEPFQTPPPIIYPFFSLYALASL